MRFFHDKQHKIRPDSTPETGQTKYKEVPPMVNVTPKQLGKNVRMSFGKITEPLEMPNLIEVQKNSY